MATSFLAGRTAAWIGGAIIGGMLVFLGQTGLARDRGHAEQGGLTVYVYVSGCSANVCTTLAVPQVTVTASINGTVIATGHTSHDGSVFLPASAGGQLEIAGTSPFLRDGRFTGQTAIIQPGKYGDLSITLPIADGIRPRG